MSVKTLFPTAMICVLLAGCRMVPPSMRRALATPYRPDNIYLRQPMLPAGIRRVAVLPLPQSPNDSPQSAGAELLEPVLLAELTKRNVFEVIVVSPEAVRKASDGNSWAAEDPLPNDFFERISQATGCDAVIFARLTVFEAYPPLRTGWKLRLVDCRQHQTWWAVDEVFDAGNNPVAAAAEAYARTELNLPNPLMADTGILHSPLRFGQYTANAIAGTLPGR
jgi:hypothetical protein